MTKKNISAFAGRGKSALVTGGGMLVFSLLLLFYLAPNYIIEPSFVQNPMMSPSWLPRVIGWLIFGMSILLIIQGLAPVPQNEEEVQDAKRGPFIRYFLMLTALVVYASCLEILGAVISSVIATLLLLIAHPVRVWWVYALIGVILPVAISLLFTRVMNVPLPLVPF
ncbi:tripartite tricarboxylate transporter TctB family protein [Marinobacterium lacunae]|uniref:tripartite tricarboxylate transporter TctB family protein n=1 Tax=Marinobacterium lacunae TaxID=1232683 RepID=UPI00068DF14F|nr:tripartite tricarboxylate transporter TctB family protein [Marinobacterium lacunae]